MNEAVLSGAVGTRSCERLHLCALEMLENVPIHIPLKFQKLCHTRTLLQPLFTVAVRPKIRKTKAKTTNKWATAFTSHLFPSIGAGAVEDTADPNSLLDSG